MTDPRTPVCDLIAELTSRGLSLDVSLEAARKVEAAIITTAKASGSTPLERERWRVKKAAQRARLAEESPSRQTGTPILSKTRKDMKKVRKEEEPGVPRVPETPADDWPEDFVEQFWKAFPPYRRQAKAKVAAKLARIRSQKVTWETLFGGVLKFAATNPGEFAPAPMVWLNDGRWDREYGTQQQGGSNGKTQGTGGGKVGFSGIAARLRERAASDSELPFGQSPDDPGHPGRR